MTEKKVMKQFIQTLGKSFVIECTSTIVDGKVTDIKIGSKQKGRWFYYSL